MLNDWFDTSRIYRQLSERENDTLAPIRFQSAIMVPGVLASIKNKEFIETYKKLAKPEGFYTYYDSFNVSKEQIAFIKNWLISNKGRYEFW